MTRRSFTIALAAGGTGGHVIPAQALAAELKRRGHVPLMLTDQRGLRYAALLPDVETIEVASAPAGSGLLTRLKSAVLALGGTLRARRILKDRDVAAVIGFGGYPSLPSGLAAALVGLPLCVHEQNAVFGASNRFLARFATLIGASFPYTKRLPENVDHHITGNPVRSAILELRDQAYVPPGPDGRVRILVIGGSQGATILSEVVPSAISTLPKAMQERLAVLQQAREEDLARVRASYASIGVVAMVLPFIDDLPRELNEAHLVIARSGASTVSELAVAGRPAVLVPFAAATDDHQTANARDLEDAGGAWVIDQAAFDPATLAKLLQSLLRDTHRLETAAAAARSVGRPQAAAELADLLERVIVARGPLAALPLRDDDMEESEVDLRRVEKNDGMTVAGRCADSTMDCRVEPGHDDINPSPPGLTRWSMMPSAQRRRNGLPGRARQ